MLTSTNNRPLPKPPSDTADGSVKRFLKDIDQALKDTPGEVILDCSQLQQVTSSHINALWQAWRLCNEAGRSLRLHQPSPGLVRVLQVLDLYDFLFTHPGSHRDSGSVQYEATGEKGGFHFQDSFGAKTNLISEAQERFHQYLESLGIDEMMTFELETIFYEVTTNIRIHGKLNRRDTIEFRVSYSNGTVLMEFTDPGKPFNMNDISLTFNPDDFISGKKTHGFGLILIKRLTDSIKYERSHNQLNILTLKKKRR